MLSKNAAQQAILQVDKDSTSVPMKDESQSSAEPQDQWNIDWWSPFLLACGIVLGIASALGHHFFNEHFNGRPIKGF